VALIVLASALVALALSGGHSAQAHSMVGKTEARISTDELALRNEMRKLWEDHVTWTRMVMVSFAAAPPDLNPAVGRLLANQRDIGDAIKPFYGDAAGDRLTALLRDQILIAADVLAAVLAAANPMMRDHLELTTEEAVARLNGDWAADIYAYDEVHRPALAMADMLSTGIVRQFAQRFR
jgi:hypothetical protein